jgi:hypothetical protein
MRGAFSRNAKTALISAAVAAVTAAVMAGAPALARNTVARTAPSPVIVAGFKNGPVALTGSGLTTVAKLHVPSGAWAIFAKAWILNLSSSTLEPDCRLVAGSSSDNSHPSLGPNTSTPATALALNVVHRFKAASTVTMKCNSFSFPMDVIQIKITAIKAGKLTSGKLG